MGRRFWEDHPAGEATGVALTRGPFRCLSFKKFLPADPVYGRKKHLVQLWCDPSGMRTLAVGAIKLKKPARAKEAMPFEDE